MNWMRDCNWGGNGEMNWMRDGGDEKVKVGVDVGLFVESSLFLCWKIRFHSALLFLAIIPSFFL